jgi:peptide/nickel transport system substrate-binding protein
LKKLVLFVMSVLFTSMLSSCETLINLDEYGQQKLNTKIFNRESILDGGSQDSGELRLYCTYLDTLDPIITENIYYKRYSSLVFESLVKLDAEQKPTPLLSDRWEASDDGLIWTFHIRNDVLWHDGVKLTAEDIEFTIKTILESNSVYRGILSNISAYAATSLDSIRIVLKKPNSFTPELMTFPIISKHNYEKTSLYGSNSQKLPIGTGPYILTGYQEKYSLNLTANEKWWNKDTNIPSIKVMLFENDKNMKTVFQSNKCDVLHVDSIDYKGYSERTGILTREFTGNCFEFISFNIKNKILCDKDIRKAISYLIDRQTIIREVLGDRAVSSALPILPDSWVFNKDKFDLSPNREKALELIEKCGWSNKNNRYTKVISGKKNDLKFELLVNNENSLRLKAANIIREQLESNNIKIEIKEVTWEEQIKLINAGKYDITLTGCRLSAIPDMSYLYSDSYLSYASSTGNEKCHNISGYDNEEVDSILKDIFAEHDEKKKLMLFDTLTDIAYDDMPYMGLYIYRNAVVVNEYVRGSIEPYVWDVLNDINGWYITPR